MRHIIILAYMVSVLILPQFVPANAATIPDYGTSVTFDAETIEAMRNLAFNLTSCPEINDYYAFENDSSIAEGWILYPCDATRIMSAFPHLSWNTDKKVAGYYFRDFLGGNAVLQVVDTNENLTIPDNISQSSIFGNLPPGDRNFLSYVSGDLTPVSYLEASILSREIPEIGAFWHGITWGTHTVLDDTIISSDQDEITGYISQLPNMTILSGPDWNWTEEMPETFDPTVIIGDETITVRFYTHTGLHEEKIVRHTDVFTPGSYTPVTNDTIIATGPAGFLF